MMTRLTYYTTIAMLVATPALAASYTVPFTIVWKDYDSMKKGPSWYK